MLLAVGSVAAMYLLGILPPATLERAQALYDSGSFEQSRAVYEKLAADDKWNIEAYEGMAKCCISLGDNDGAIAVYEDCYPESSYERYLRISELHIAAGDVKSAVAVLEDGMTQLDGYSNRQLQQELNKLVSERLQGSWRVKTVNGSSPDVFAEEAGERSENYFFNIVFDKTDMKLEIGSEEYTLFPYYSGRSILLSFEGNLLTMQLDAEDDAITFSYFKDGTQYTIVMEKGRHDIPFAVS